LKNIWRTGLSRDLKQSWVLYQREPSLTMTRIKVTPTDLNNPEVKNKVTRFVL